MVCVCLDDSGDFELVVLLYNLWLNLLGDLTFVGLVTCGF